MMCMAESSRRKVWIERALPHTYQRRFPELDLQIKVPDWQQFFLWGCGGGHSERCLKWGAGGGGHQI